MGKDNETSRSKAGHHSHLTTIPQGGLETVIRDLASRKTLAKEFLQPDLYKDDALLQKLIKDGWFEQLRK